MSTFDHYLKRYYRELAAALLLVVAVTVAVGRKVVIAQDKPIPKQHHYKIVEKRWYQGDNLPEWRSGNRVVGFSCGVQYNDCLVLIEVDP